MKRFFVFLFLLAVHHSLSAAVNDWQTFTNTRQIRQIALSDSLVWCATNGGVLAFNTETESFLKYTNTEGLAQIDIDAIAYDANGYVWVGMDNGLLQFLDEKSGLWDSYNEFKNQLSINFILPQHDHVLVATSIGIAELRLDSKERWERTWKADIGEVYQILVAQDYIWVAQKDGLRRIPVDFPNKQVPNEWQHFTRFDGMPANKVNSLFEYGELIAVGTINGVGFFDGTAWYGPEKDDISFLSMTEWNGGLAAVTSDGLFYRDLNGNWTRKGARITNYNQVVVTPHNSLLASASDDGLWEFDENESQWFAHLPQGPGSNVFEDLVFDDDRWLWAACQRDGITVFDGEHWQTFKIKAPIRDENDMRLVDFRCVEVDNYNRVWAGSWGHGVFLFEKSADGSITYTQLGTMNDQLGMNSADGFTVITDIMLDSNENLWFANYAAMNKRTLHVYDLVDRWQHWSTTDGILSDKILKLAEYYNNYGNWIWMATESGVSVLQPLDDVFDKSDDDLSGTLTTADGLESNYISAIASDLDFQVWVGTSDGLFYWLSGPGLTQEFRVINDNTTAIFVDGVNNKWIGSSEGVTLKTANNRYTYYSTSNSQIVSDNVTCFALNRKNGDLFIGTTNGLSKLETPYTQPFRNLRFVKGYPNPFVIKDAFSEFYIDNLAYDSTVKIFTPDGFLVKTFSSSQLQGARVAWDGRNNKGDYVASGIYIFVVTTPEGEQNSGKIAVVR